jgi:hypothetical protein
LEECRVATLLIIFKKENLNMAKENKKELVKFVKKLNKLELVDEVEVDGDFDEIKEGFISAIEEIDDDGQIDEVDDKIVTYYESFIEDQPEEEGEEKTEEKESDELKEELDEMNAKELKAFVEENDLDIDCKISKKNLEEAVDEILEAMAEKDEAPEEEEEEEEEKPKKKKKGKKDKKSKKGKKDKKEEKEKKKKSKSKVKGKLPTLLLDAIEDGGATWGELAEIVAEEKDKDADKCLGIVLRTISRKVSKVMPVILTMAGDEEEATFTLVEEE